jgi:hypothetical protein
MVPQARNSGPDVTIAFFRQIEAVTEFKPGYDAGLTYLNVLSSLSEHG